AEHVLTRGLLALGVSLQIHLVAVFVVFLRHPYLDPYELFLRVAGVALYTAVVAPVALVALSRALPPREKRS
ncbi:MAG: hypothetical protein HY720_23060, partial [Planctomycetes bacterium]|nr:hypothetical protein [Planctomycetota bacterium]